ncbi:MAG: type II secretion system F family protein [Candidatus Bathyarchaeia archaeon]
MKLTWAKLVKPKLRACGPQSAEKVVSRRSLGDLKICGLSLAMFFLAFTVGFISTENPSQIVNSPLERFAALGVILALIPPSLFYQIESRRKEAIDNNLPILLQDIAEAGSLGMTLIRSIEVSAERNYGPLTKELKVMAAQLSWKVPLDKALNLFAERCRTSLAKSVAFLIKTAYRSGGDVQESIETINLHIQELQSQERRRKVEMRPHIAIIYMTFAVFLVTVYFLITQFFGVSISGLETVRIGSAIGGFRNPADLKESLRPIFFYMAMVEGVLSGLAGGKISTGSIRDGFIHSTILCSVTFIVFMMI